MQCVKISSFVRACGALGLLVTVACDSSREPPQPAEAKAEPQAQAEPQPDAPDKAAKPKMPPQARRNSPPEGLDGSALAVGSPAPPMDKLPSTQGTWSRGAGPTIVVFYRGFW